MKLVACISWFDEDPHRLAQCVRDVHALGATDIVAVDGGYMLFPGARRKSFYAQADALQGTASELDLGFLLYQPSHVWVGNEVEKRQTMLRIALAITTIQDWWILWDADFHLDSGPLDLKHILCGSWMFGDVELTDSQEDAGWYPVRLFYRAVPGMYLSKNHYSYHHPDGTSTVMNNPQDDDLARGLKLPIRVRHRQEDRIAGRRAKQVEYYRQRHALKIES